MQKFSSLVSITLRVFGVGWRTVGAAWGGSRTSGARATRTVGSLSATDNRPPKADPIARRRRGHKTPDNRDVSPFGRFPHPSNYFWGTNSTSGLGPAPQSKRWTTPTREVHRLRHSAVVLANFPGISHFASPKWRLKLLPVLVLT